MSWKKFSERRPPSFKDVIYQYHFFSGEFLQSEKKIVTSVGWVESEEKEELAIWDIQKFTIYENDEEGYELIRWMEIPE